MKKLFRTSFILLALLGVMFTSCKKEYEIPPIPVLPVGDVYTIGDLLAMPANTTFDTASVYGIVTADEQSGNLYKNIFIQDRRTGKAIELMMNTSSAARVGDSVRVFLDKNIMVNNYHNLPQLVGKDGKGFNPDGHLIIYPYNKPIDPVTVTIADIKTGNYTAGLVRLENVEFNDQGSPFCNVGENTNRTLKDATGELLVRTSNYANFAYDLIPAGKGSLVAIASVYNSDWQLLIRSKNELQFEGGEPTPPAPPGEVQHLPYTQSFSSDFGTYMTYDVLGSEGWVIDYSTAKMTGYVNSVYNANEDWLISSPVDLSGINAATVTMSYIGRYFTNINEEITLWASTDYTYGNDPTSANWVQLPARLTEVSNWTDFLTAEIALAGTNGETLVGQTATIAVKYTSTAQKAGTMEIQSITIAEAGSTPTPPPGPGGDVQSLPYYQSFETEFGSYTTYDVMGAQSWMIDFKTAKMTGYDGGAYYANEDWLISSPVALTGVNGAKMTMEYIGRYFTNINNEITVWASTDYVYGSNPTSATWRPVSASLSEGTNWTDFLTAEISLNEYLGQTVSFAVKYTSTDSKAGTMEIKSITIQEGNGGTPVPPPPGPGGDVQSLPYSQSFETEFGSYTTYDINGPQSWMIDFQTAKMTGYVSGENYANEDWLISSPVAITGVNDAKMTMVYIGRYFTSINDEVTVWASTDYTYGNNPTSASWRQVSSSLSEASNWTNFLTAEISLSDYVGQTATFAVKYTSTANKAGTLEIKSITIQEGNGGTPTPPPGPGTGNGTQDNPYDVASGISLQSEEPIAWVQGYIVGSVKDGNTSVSSNDQIHWSAPFDLVTNVLIADDPNCHEISQCIIVNLPAGKPLRTEVNLVDHPENLGKTLAVLGKLRKYFGQAGLRESNGTESDFILDGSTPGPGPTPPPTPGEVQQLPYIQSFATEFGSYTPYDISGPQSWIIDYSTAKMTGYENSSYAANEDWLVSSPFDLPVTHVPSMRVEYIGRYFTDINEEVTFWISPDYVYGNNPSSATWIQLPSELVESSNWNDFKTAVIDMSVTGQFMQGPVTIAVKYTSTDQAAGTIEIKSIAIE